MFDFLSNFSTLDISLWLANGFIWGLIIRIYFNLRVSKYNKEQPMLTLGDVLYIVFISTPAGFISVFLTLIFLIGLLLSESDILHKPLIK